MHKHNNNNNNNMEVLHNSKVEMRSWLWKCELYKLKYENQAIQTLLMSFVEKHWNSWVLFLTNSRTWKI